MYGQRKKKRKVPLIAGPLFSSCWWPGKWTIFKGEKQTNTGTETVTTSEETVTTVSSPIPFADGIDHQQFVQGDHGDIEEEGEQWTNNEDALPPRSCPTFTFQKLSKEQFLRIGVNIRDESPIVEFLDVVVAVFSRQD